MYINAKILSRYRVSYPSKDPGDVANMMLKRLQKVWRRHWPALSEVGSLDGVEKDIQNLKEIC